MESSIYGHFASAPFFLIIDTETSRSSVVANCDPANPFAGCNPFSALSGWQLDGIVVGGIGDEAVRAMNICGFTVYQAGSDSVALNLALFEDNNLPEVTIMGSHLEGRCSAGEGGHGCNHHHSH